MNSISKEQVARNEAQKHRKDSMRVIDGLHALSNMKHETSIQCLLAEVCEKIYYMTGTWSDRPDDCAVTNEDYYKAIMELMKEADDE